MGFAVENKDTGYLLNEQNIKLNRFYFKQFLSLHGLNIQYRVPIEGVKDYTLNGELDSKYYPAKQISCIFEEHPSQKSMQKMGWSTELLESSVVIHVPYDTEGLQAGCLFIIPAGLDNAEPRIFKLLRMQNIAIFPASISCELGPIYQNTLEPAEVIDFEKSDFNLLADEYNDYGR